MFSYFDSSVIFRTCDILIFRHIVVWFKEYLLPSLYRIYYLGLLVSSIIKCINSIFLSFRNEYDFLPVVEPKHNRSPLVLQEHKLGLELWSVKILYQYAYNTLMSWRQKEPQAKFLGKQVYVMVIVCNI